jgi:hypothetical protein
MERFPWHPRLGHAAIARPLVIAVVAALALAVLAVAGMAATNGTRGGAAPGPNGCPTNKSAKTAPTADLAPPARLRSSPSTCCRTDQYQPNSFTLKVRREHGVNIKARRPHPVPRNYIQRPAEELTGDEGTAIPLSPTEPQRRA